MYCHQLRNTCLCHTLVAYFLVWKSFSHSSISCILRNCRVIDPEYFSVCALETFVGNDLIDFAGEILLIHWRNVIETRTVLINVRANSWALCWNISMIFDDKDITCLENFWVSSPLEVPNVWTTDEVLCFYSKNSNLNMYYNEKLTLIGRRRV